MEYTFSVEEGEREGENAGGGIRAGRKSPNDDKVQLVE